MAVGNPVTSNTQPEIFKLGEALRLTVSAPPESSGFIFCRADELK
jgi:hypothetical protein